MIIDVLLAARVVRDIDQRETAADFATGTLRDGDLDGLALWSMLTGSSWPTVAAFTNQSQAVDVADAPRAAALLNTDGRVGVQLGFGYCAAPVGRTYAIGPFDPDYWDQAWLPQPVVFTNGGR